MGEDEQYKELAEKSSDWIWSVDVNGRLTYVYSWKNDFLGYQPEELLGKDLFSLMDPGEARRMQKIFHGALKTREPFYLLVNTLTHKEGHRVHIETTGVPISGPGGNLEGFQGIARDITARKETEEALAYRSRFEKVVSLVSNRLVNAPVAGSDQAITYALELIGDFFQVDRTYLARPSPGSGNMETSHEWCREGTGSQGGMGPLEGIGPRGGGETGYTLGSSPWLGSKIRERDYVYLAGPEDLPAGAEEERREMRRRKIRSFLCLPLKDEKGVTGFLGFDSVRKKKQWTQEQISLARYFAGIFSGALARQQVEEELLVKDQAIASSINAIALADLAGELTYVNPAFLQLWGHGEEKEVLGRSALDFWEDPGQAAGIMSHLSREGSYVGDLVARRVDGQLRHVHLSATLVYGRDGRPRNMFASFIDNTRRVQAEETLRKSESRYRLLANYAADIVSLFEGGRLVYVSPSHEIILGYSPDEHLGIRVSELREKIHPEDRARLSREVQHNKEKKLPIQGYQYRFLHKDGHYVWLEDLIYRDWKALDHRVVVRTRDITELKQAEQRLAEYTCELEELYQQLNQELDKASHIHQRLLPRSLPGLPGLSLAAHYQPARRLGGDFYNVVQVGDKLLIYLSDVSGHGLDSALLTSFLKGAIDSYLTLQPGKIAPRKILRHLCRQYRRENYSEEYFICIFLAVLDLKTLELTYSAAGFQDSPLVETGDGRRLELIKAELPISNAFPQGLVDIQESSLYLPPGTTVLFNTDGLTEQQSGDKMYGRQLKEVFYRNTHRPPEGITRAINHDFQQFNQGSPQGDDDITFVILQTEKQVRDGS